MAVQTFAVSPAQPVIVARVNRRNITQSIPATTMFTPAHTGLFRVSTYMTATSPGGSENWMLALDYSDGAPKFACLATLNPSSSSNIPFDCYSGGLGLAGPFIFEGIGGEPVAFEVTAPLDDAGTISVAIVVERLE